MNLHQRMLSKIRTRTELSEARLKLSAARAEYRAGGYCGHPEEKLEEIESFERTIARLQTVIAEKKEIDYPALDQVDAELDQFYTQARSDGFSRDLMNRISEVQQRWQELSTGETTVRAEA